MHDDKTITTILESVPLVSVNTTVSRFIPFKHSTTPLKAVGRSGRYNMAGTKALYTSYRRRTALSEITQLIEDEDPLEPMLLLSISVASSQIMDLTNAALHRRLGVRRAELDASIIDKSADASVPQRLGHLAYGVSRIHGLQVWSHVERREKNLVLFVDRLCMNYTLHDPERVVASDHPAIAEAMDRLMTR